MKNVFLLILVLTTFLLSCGSNSENEIKPEPIKRDVFEITPNEAVYSELRPTIQSFTIDNNKPNTIKTEKGTEIWIPENCFVDAGGNPVNGNVKIEIVEAFSMSDFITSGLTTLSEGELIMSNGMIHVDAKSEGLSLNLKEDAVLEVSMPTITANNGYQMFTGDGKNWTVDSSMLTGDYLIPLPLNLLYPYGNSNFGWYWETSDSKSAIYDTSVVSLTNPNYENTIIATKEFRDRFWVLMNLEGYLYISENAQHQFTWMYGYAEERDYSIWSIYYNNLNESFAVLDSLAIQKYTEHYEANKSAIIGYCNAMNDFIASSLPTEEAEVKKWFMEPLKWLPNADNRKIKTIDDYGVDLNSENAYEELKKKGVKSSEINEILSYNFKRQNIIKELEREKKIIDDKKAHAEFLETTAFSIKKLGWINCDRFFDSEKAAEAEILVSNSSEHKLDFIDFSLVIPSINSRLMSFPYESKKYSFTKKEGPYTKLPIGESAVVVGISLQKDLIYFGSQRITIKDGISVDISMQPITKEALKDSLEMCVKPIQSIGD